MSPVFLTDEERAKKDDDLRPPTRGSEPLFRLKWIPASPAHRSRILLKRLAVAVALAVLVYLFVHNIPTDVPIRDRRRPLYVPIAEQGRENRTPGPMPGLSPASRAPPRQKQKPAGQGGGDEPLAAYNGPVQFERLLESLQAIQDAGVWSGAKGNVLFAAASLRSAALLLPLACRMGGEQRNSVHFALLGGSGIDMDELRAVNGIDESCKVAFHDGRPNMATKSTPKRLRLSTSRAIYHINKHIRPQALVVDASGAEEDYFLTGVRNQALDDDITLIELPSDAHSRLGWITKLDSSSLAAWGKVRIDILIPASPVVPGSLVHFLKSLSAADFSAGPIPHLTIELPHHVDRTTADYLDTFQWPPDLPRDSSSPSQLTLRRRIPRTRLTEEESSVRFLESFWPGSYPKYSHVLVLSPRVQLSTQFFHYVKYTVLHYLYSNPAAAHEWDARLLGISLDLPSSLLDGNASFSPPTPATMKSSTGTSMPFLWQAPNSNAVLFPGPKWAELHALVVESVAYEQQHGDVLPRFLTDKLVAKTHPAWLEHALRLARARGYLTLYPSEPVARNLATVHAELYRAPEEYAAAGGGSHEWELRGAGRDDAELPAPGNTLFETLPGGGKLPALEEMPVLAWDGRETKMEALDREAKTYADEFRRAVGGGCEMAPTASMRDLFCLRDE